MSGRRSLGGSGGKISGGGRISGGNYGGARIIGGSFGGGCSFGGGGRRGGGSSRGGGRSFNGSGGGRSGGGARSFNGSGGRGRSLSGSGRSVGGNNSSGGERISGSRNAGGRVGGSHSADGGRISGGSMSGKGSGRDYEPHLSNDDTYNASLEDSEEDDQFDDASISGDGEAGGYDGEGGEGGEDEGDDREGSAIDTDDGDDIYYSRRGYSLGIYANIPQRPHPIRMVKKVIDNPTASRTLLALTRIYWPVGCIGTKDIDRRFPRWWRFIRKKFFKYYTYDPRHGTEQDARRAVSYHLHTNIRKTQANERKRVQKLIKENGGTFLDHRPPYFSEPVWKAFCDHWDSPAFKKKSDQAKENRKKQRFQHKSGAISYRRRAWNVLKETGEEPGEYDIFVKTHTDDAGIFTSEAVVGIVKRYLHLCEKQNVDPSHAPIYTWAEAVGVRKNSILGVPRTKASDLIPKERKRRRRREDDESGASTNGRSVHMADDFVIQAVDQTVAYARAHPEQFGFAPEQVRMLAQSVAEGDVDLPSDHPLSMETMTELVRVMVSVLTDIQARNNLDSNKGKGKTFVYEDDCSGSSSDSPPPVRKGIH